MYARRKRKHPLRCKVLSQHEIRSEKYSSHQPRATTLDVDGTKIEIQEKPRRTQFRIWNNASRNKVSSEVELHNGIHFSMRKFLISSGVVVVAVVNFAVDDVDDVASRLLLLFSTSRGMSNAHVFAIYCQLWKSFMIFPSGCHEW